MNFKYFLVVSCVSFSVVTSFVSGCSMNIRCCLVAELLAVQRLWQPINLYRCSRILFMLPLPQTSSPLNSIDLALLFHPYIYLFIIY